MVRYTARLGVLALLAGFLVVSNPVHAHTFGTANPNATLNTRQALDWLAHAANRVPAHGKVVSGLFGGHSGSGYSRTVANDIFTISGERPTIHGCDLGVLNQTAPTPFELPDLISGSCAGDLQNWAAEGGLITVSVRMANPAFVQDGSGQYSNPVPVNGGGVKPRQSQASSRSDFATLTDPGSSNGQRWRQQLDKIATILDPLDTAGVPVLFRPFQEMNGTYFWWSDQDPGVFKLVWQSMFEYLTYFRGLNNLLWVFSPGVGGDEYYPSGYVDIVGVDLVPANGSPAIDPRGQSFGDLIQLGKPFAFAEVGAFGGSESYPYWNLIRYIRDTLPLTTYTMAMNGAHSPTLNGWDAYFATIDSWSLNRGRTDGMVPTEAGIGGWSIEASVGGPTAAQYITTPAVASWGPLRHDVFVIRRVSGQRDTIEHRVHEVGKQVVIRDISVIDTSPSGTYFFLHHLTAVARDFGVIDLFAEASTSSGGLPQILHTTITPTSPANPTWAVATIDLGAAAAPAVSSWGPKRLDLFALREGRLRHKWWDDGQWSGWEDLGDTPNPVTHAPRGVSAVSWGPQRIDLFSVNDTGTLSHMYYDEFDGGWHPWRLVSELDQITRLTAVPTVSSWGDGRLDVWSRSPTQELLHTWFENGVWGPWEGLGGNLRAFESAGVVSRALNKIDIRYLGSTSNPGLFRRTWGCSTSLCDNGMQIPPRMPRPPRVNPPGRG